MSKTVWGVGQIVFSKSGRDAGKTYMVYDIIKKDFVLLVDGKSRKLARPKLKNQKHIRVTRFTVPCFLEKKQTGQRVTDGEIYTAIHEFLKQRNEEGQENCVKTRCH